MGDESIWNNLETTFFISEATKEEATAAMAVAEAAATMTMVEVEVEEEEVKRRTEKMKKN